MYKTKKIFFLIICLFGVLYASDETATLHVQVYPTGMRHRSEFDIPRNATYQSIIDEYIKQTGPFPSDVKFELWPMIGDIGDPEKTTFNPTAKIDSKAYEISIGMTIKKIWSVRVTGSLPLKNPNLVLQLDLYGQPIKSLRKKVKKYIRSSNLTDKKYYVVDITKDGKALPDDAQMPMYKETISASYGITVDELIRNTQPNTLNNSWGNWWQQQRTKIFGALGFATLGSLYLYTNKTKS
jgi:hypothetical protein